ncbi:hypothetical protein [Nocardia sp. XZ_19_385]|uniref:hypothetical protein n=1 Tax=Nocardia sp. XZ_19_385 TaxID=2769488 RepID=UPI00188E2F98|nr:hypothetical protein [Nocardia sp. XZ_19_385]
MSRWKSPLSGWETWWLFATPAMVLLILLPISTVMKPGPLLGFSKKAFPVYTALPDLCALPVTLLPDPLLRPDLDDRDLDRNSASCDFGRDATQPEGGRARIRAYRPAMDLYDTVEKRLASARRSYETATARTGAPFVPVGMLGEEAKLAVDDQDDSAELWVRDGLLFIEIYVSAPTGDPGEAAPAAQRIAAELLNTLPRDGR